MKKNQVIPGIAPLIKKVRTLVDSARRTAATAVNTLQVRTNFEIGRLIVEHEQRGRRRAGYGDVLIRTLARRLTVEFGEGFSKRNLDYIQQFYLLYRDRFPQIVQTPSAQLITGRIGQTAFGQLSPSRSFSAFPKPLHPNRFLRPVQ